MTQTKPFTGRLAALPDPGLAEPINVSQLQAVIRPSKPSWYQYTTFSHPSPTAVVARQALLESDPRRSFRGDETAAAP